MLHQKEGLQRDLDQACVSCKELQAEVMPVQIDYENRQLKFLPSFDMAGTKDEIIKRMRLKFDGIRVKKKNI